MTVQIQRTIGIGIAVTLNQSHFHISVDQLACSHVDFDLSRSTSTLGLTMFQTVITLLTTTALVIHAVLGCCAHHGHCDEHALGDCSGEHQPVCDHEHSDATHLDHDHICCTVPGDDSTPEDDHQSCDEGECSYLTSSADDFGSLLTFSHWTACPGIPATPGDFLAEMNASRLSHDPPDASACFRAKLQVWLL